MVSELAVPLVLIAGQFLMGIALALASAWGAVFLFSHLTAGMKWSKEVRAGNAAVSVLLAACAVSIGIVLASGLSGFTDTLLSSTSSSAYLAIMAGLFRVAAGIAGAAASSYISLRVIDVLTSEIDEVKELSGGNMAVALLMAGVLIGTAIVMSAGVSGTSLALGALF